MNRNGNGRPDEGGHSPVNTGGCSSHLQSSSADFRSKQRNSIPFWLERGAPVIPGDLIAPDTVQVACPYCSRAHRHGALDEPGHRWPPCGIPADAPGYVVVVVRAVAEEADGEAAA